MLSTSLHPCPGDVGKSAGDPKRPCGYQEGTRAVSVRFLVLASETRQMLLFVYRMQRQGKYLNLANAVLSVKHKKKR